MHNMTRTHELEHFAFGTNAVEVLIEFITGMDKTVNTENFPVKSCLMVVGICWFNTRTF